MQNKNTHMYLLTIEHDNYYDTKEFDSYLFETKDDAIEYMKDLIESYKVDFAGNYDVDIDQLMLEYVDETRSGDDYINWYIEDDCNIEFSIQEKPILKFS